MLRRPHKIVDDEWANPSSKSAGFTISEDSFAGQYLNFQYLSAVLVLLHNALICALYDSAQRSEIAVVSTLFVMHHCRKADDQVLTNMSKWTRFVIDAVATVFALALCGVSALNVVLFGAVLCALWLCVLLDEPGANLSQRENFRNRTSLNGADRFYIFIARFLPICALNALFTLPLFLFSAESYFRMRWFVCLAMLNLWTDEFVKIVGEFGYMARYMFVVLILSLNLVHLLVEDTATQLENVFSVMLIVCIALGWIFSVFMLFANNLFPHEIWAYLTN